ncbi:type II toxin-antitoxin system RelE/ParE family toxin [Mesorhizobium xinjiangense]|uniref:type II toxin-antitoxin system RelE/ParE family toxin n=1 Tax=Mesorhizobium xinjiangense TaxID=2678685 RepID=UPI001F18931E|nr:type II toxin-antitoxin system RelE/ParE family toxin [Mesorhizobium xinjiangense]
MSDYKIQHVVFTPLAEYDLSQIHDYIAGNSAPRIAAAFIDRIESACAALAEFPMRGVARDDLAPGIRTTNVEGRTLIAYRIEGHTLRIIRIFYAGRDFEAELSEP